MTVLARLLAAATLVATPVAAASEPQLPRGAASDGVRLPYLYAGCLVDADRARIEKMLLQDQSGDAFRSWHRKLRGTCINLDNEDFYLNPASATLRMIVADLLARKVRGQLDAEKLAAIPALAHPGVAAQLGEARVFQVGECLVRSAPDDAAALLGTTPKSVEEAAATEQLLGGTGRCAGGKRLNVDMIGLRGSVALSYLRLAKASTAAMATGGAR